MSKFFDIERLNFSYENQSVLNLLSLQLESGKTYALLGPNAVGKSTLLKIATGLIAPRSQPESWVRFRGTDVQSYSALERAERLAYVPAELSCTFPIQVIEFVGLGTFHRQMQNGVSESEVEALSKEALREVGLEGLSQRQFQTLSGGERQLATLARLKVQGSQLLCLDEALSHLDLNHQEKAVQILNNFKSKNKTIVVVSHDLHFSLKLADELILLHQGKILAQGKPVEILNERYLKTMYPDLKEYRYT